MNRSTLEQIRRRTFSVARTQALPRVPRVSGGRTLAPPVGVPTTRPVSADRALATKYALDRALALTCLLIALPVMAVVALAVRLSTGGPVLYRERRLGEGGREFEMLKFRTMTGSPDTDGEADREWINRQLGRPVASAAVADRTTSIGRILRRLSLDELPQVFNVLRGDMSIVGPRPERAAVARLFTDTVDRYADRHRMRPGMTGWAQVRGLRGATSLPKRVESDNYYIEHWSLWFDLKVLLLTIPAIARASQSAR